MARGAIDLLTGLVRGFVQEIVRVAKIGIPAAILAMVVLFAAGSHPAVAVVGGLLAGLLVAAVAIAWAIESDGGEEWAELRSRRRSGRLRG